jgi:hypothetical protein
MKFWQAKGWLELSIPVTVAHGESDRMTITKQRPNRKELICKRNYGVPLVSSFAQANALFKAAHRERHHHAAGVFAEDFGGAGDLSSDVQADIALTQITDIEYPQD